MGFNLLLDIFADALATGERPSSGIQVIHEETIVPTSLDETFSFFSDAFNLEKLTPAWLNFHIRAEGPMKMRAGLEIDYAIVLHGFPIPWKTVIDVWEPGVRFVDRQINGPYVWWNHEHDFEAAAGGGTRVIDHVEFVPRLRLFTSRFVRRDVERIFAYRKEALKRIFAAEARHEA